MVSKSRFDVGQGIAECHARSLVFCHVRRRKDHLKSSRAVIFTLYGVICLIWGSTWLAIKIGLESVPPVLAAGLRFVVASVVLLGLMRVRRISLSKDRKTLMILVGIGVISFYVPFALVYWGQQHIATGLSAIVFAVYPFLVAVLSYFFLPNEPLSFYKIIGIIIGFAGIYVIFSTDLNSTGSLAFWGMLAVLASAVLQSVGLILIKRYAGDVHPVSMSLVMMCSSALLLLVTGLVLESPASIALDLRAIGSILYLGIFGSVVAFVIYFWLLQRMEAVILSLSALITPVLAVILGAVVLGEVLGSRIFVGAFLVFLGVLITSLQTSKASVG